ncbi:MAG: hypothetical protein ABI939_06890 [Anaerolineaceae bacterium]
MRLFHASPHPIGRAQAGVSACAFEFRSEAVALDLQVSYVISQGGDEEINFAVAALGFFAESPGFACEVAEGAGFDRCGTG